MKHQRTSITLHRATIALALVAMTATMVDPSGFENPKGLNAAPLDSLTPAARYMPTMVTIGNSVYLFGGLASTTSSPSVNQPRAPLPAAMDDLWQFADQWEQLTPANLPAARYGHSATAANGKMYISGGKDAASNPFSDLWVYDAFANTWTQLPQQGTEQPGPRTGHQVVAIGNNIYLFGGKSDSVGTLASPDAWKYDPATNQWEKKAACPCSSRHSFSAANIGDRMVVWGGYPPVNNTLYSYDPATNQWSPVTLTNAPDAFGSMATVAAGNQLWMFGGYSYSNVTLDNVWEFNFTSNTQATASMWQSLPTSRYYSAAATLPASGTQSPRVTFQVPVLIFGGGRDPGLILAEQTTYTITVTAVNQIYLPLVVR